MAFLGATEFGVDMTELETRTRAAAQPPTGGAASVAVEPAGQKPPVVAAAAPPKSNVGLIAMGLAALAAGVIFFSKS